MEDYLLGLIVGFICGFIWGYIMFYRKKEVKGGKE